MTGLKVSYVDGDLSGNYGEAGFTLPGTGLTSFELNLKYKLTGNPAIATTFLMLRTPDHVGFPNSYQFALVHSGNELRANFEYQSHRKIYPVQSTAYEFRVLFVDTNTNGVFDQCQIYQDDELIHTVNGVNISVLPDTIWLGAINQSSTNTGTFDLFLDDITIDYETAQAQTSVKLSQDVDLSEWTSVTQNGSSTIVSHADAGMASTAGGLKITIASGDTAYVRKDFDEFAGVAHQIDLHINKEGLTMADSDSFVIAQIRNASNAAIGRLHLSRSTTNRRIVAEFKDDGGTYRATAAQDITASEDHRVKAIVKRSASTASEDGSIELWIDGSLVETVSDLDIFDADHWAQIRVGAVDLLDAGTSGELWLDEVELTDLGEAEEPEIAFTGAEGYGAKTIIASPVPYYVTSLADTNTVGTLRYALQTVTGDTKISAPALDGWIPLTGVLRIERPGVHIDFSNSPGKGLGLKNHTFEIRDSAIVRYCRFYPGLAHPSPDDGDAVNIRLAPTGSADIDGVILDHCQLFYAIDGTLDITNGRWDQSYNDYMLTNISITNCIIAWHLESAGHSEGDHSRPILISKGVTNVTMANNIIFGCHTRTPFFNPEGVLEFTNNIIAAVREGSRFGQKNNANEVTVNAVSNIYRNGTTTRNTKPILINVEHSDPEEQAEHKIYLAGNATMDALGNLTIPTDQRAGLTSHQWGSSGSPADPRFFVPSANPWSEVKPVIRDAAAAWVYTLANAGVVLPASDSSRDAVIAHIEAGTGGIIDTEAQGAGYPDLS